MIEMKEGIDYFCNFYRSMLYDHSNEQYLITLDDGKFLFLNKYIFKQFKKGRITDESTFELAKDKGLIITPDNVNSIVENLKTRYQFLTNGTSLHIVIPTIRCNLACPYCFAEPVSMQEDRNLYDMNEKTAKDTVRYIMNSPGKAITFEFTGGEPTARFDMVKLMVEYAEELNLEYKKDLKFSIVTNLTLMNDEIAEFLIKHNINICTSLDGPEIVHDANRVILGAKSKQIGTFNMVYYWINEINRKYKEKGITNKVRALMTITRYSFEYYKEILDLYAELGIYQVDIRAMMYIGRAVNDENNPNEYSYEEFKVFYKKCLAYIEELNERGIPMIDRMTEIYRQKIYDNSPGYHVDFESPWGAGTGSLTYSPVGDIYACHESIGKDEFKLGTIYDHKWKDLFKTDELASTVLTSMLESNPMCDKCVFKPYCGTSPIENLFSLNKLHFYPPNTMKHHETLFHAYNYFNKELDEIVDNERERKIQMIEFIINNAENSKFKSITPDNNEHLINFYQKIQNHLKNSSIKPENREISFSQTLKNKELFKDRVFYHCKKIDEKEQEINFLQSTSNNPIVEVLANLIRDGYITEYGYSCLKYNSNLRQTVYLSLNKNYEKLFEKLNLPNSLKQLFMKSYCISIDSIDGEIIGYKIYQRYSKQQLIELINLPINIESISANDFSYGKRFDPSFNQTSYKIEPLFDSNDVSNYSNQFSHLIENQNILITRFSLEYNLENQFLKESCYYFIIP